MTKEREQALKLMIRNFLDFMMLVKKDIKEIRESGLYTSRGRLNNISGYYAKHGQDFSIVIDDSDLIFDIGIDEKQPNAFDPMALSSFIEKFYPDEINFETNVEIIDNLKELEKKGVIKYDKTRVVFDLINFP